MPTYIDKTINLFFSEIGGFEFLALMFGSLIIIAIIISLIKPFDF